MVMNIEAEIKLVHVQVFAQMNTRYPNGIPDNRLTYQEARAVTQDIVVMAKANGRLPPDFEGKTVATSENGFLYLETSWRSDYGGGVLRVTSLGPAFALESARSLGAKTQHEVSIGRTKPEYVLEFRVGNQQVLGFKEDGTILVRGTAVDNNREVYAALIEFMYRGGLPDTVKRIVEAADAVFPAQVVDGVDLSALEPLRAAVSQWRKTRHVVR